MVWDAAVLRCGEYARLPSPESLVGHDRRSRDSRLVRRPARSLLPARERSTLEVSVPAETVRVSRDTLTADPSDGRTISVPLAWYPRLIHATRRSATTGDSSAKTRASTGRTWTRTLASRGLSPGAPQPRADVPATLARGEAFRPPRDPGWASAPRPRSEHALSVMRLTYAAVVERTRTSHGAYVPRPISNTETPTASGRSPKTGAG